MPQQNNLSVTEPESVEWDYYDEIYTARGYIPGYGTFICHSVYREECIEMFMEFAESIRQEIIEYGYVDMNHAGYWLVPAEEIPNQTAAEEFEQRQTPPDDHFGFGDDFLDVEYF